MIINISHEDGLSRHRVSSWNVTVQIAPEIRQFKVKNVSLYRSPFSDSLLDEVLDYFRNIEDDNSSLR